MAINQNPTVSVVIPTYNYGRFISMAIDSALGQTLPPMEIIVVDDGSTDDTAEVCARYGGKIRYIRKENGGPSSARNAGIAAATGDLIALLDADDRWLPEKLALQIPFFSEEKVGLVHGGSRVFDHDTGATLCELPGKDALDFHQILRWNLISAPTCVFPRAIIAEIGDFDIKLIEAEDWDLWIRIAAAGYKLRACTDLVVEYRTHAWNSSRSKPLRTYETCMTVLDKYENHHPNCPECRTAIQGGRTQTRQIYYAKASAIARDTLAAGDLWITLKWRLRSVWYYPGIILRVPHIIRKRLLGQTVTAPEPLQL
jgi:glycosyltransferase involved in cell wall biosynthesis